MSDDVRVYRLARSRATGVILVVAAVLAVVVFEFLQSRSDFDHYALLFLFCTVGSAGLALAWLLLTGATYASSDALITSGFRTRATPWSEVADIRIEGAASRWTTANWAVVYDTAGHRRGLPNLNDHNKLDLTSEVERLKVLWRRNRGRGWARSAAVQDARRPAGKLRVYLGCVVLEFFVSAIIVVVIDLNSPELSPGDGAGVVGFLTLALAVLTAILMPFQRHFARRATLTEPRPSGKRQRR